MTPEKPPSLRGLTVMVVVFALIFVAGFGAFYATVLTRPQATVTQQSSGVYHLSLLEPMNSGWNATLAQPQFFVVGPKGLESSANIVLPLKTLIQVTIVSYDTPSPMSTDQQGMVSGTVGGNVYLINGTAASMATMPEQWGKNVTSVPGSVLAHTFTIPDLGVNMPVVGGDTTMAYLYFTRAGTFSWFCLTPCGFGVHGAMGAMMTAGWMTGQITVR